MDTVSDDLRLGKDVADSINNLSCFDVNDLFRTKCGVFRSRRTLFKASTGDR
ncbi:MAG: hypothetical protein ACLS4Z_05880 [Christensenellaceae bacterium]